MGDKERRMPVEQVALSIEAAAEALSVGRDAVFGLIADGSLPSLRVGRRRLISAEGLREFVARRAAEAADATPALSR
jgi:excisionase family DNA binding protein